ncbi:MAG: hypothetical protein AMJ43_05030 [Coxiella sp. DG_40]|nr:MAG: hypothetical protein AMJ43_05030 [Coxiella sp. DG_40]
MLTIQKTWDIAYALRDLYYAGILDIGCTYTICINAEYAQYFARVLIFLHENDLLIPESREAIRRHANLSEYILNAHYYLHYGKILNQKTSYIICKYLVYVEEIAEALGALYRAQTLNKKTFFTLCNHLDNVKGIARALDVLGPKNFYTIIENEKQSLNIAKIFECVGTSRTLHNHSNDIIEINQKNFHFLCEHLDGAEEIAEAFQSLNEVSIPLNQYYFDAICKNQKMARKIPIYVEYIKTIINQYTKKSGKEYKQTVLNELSKLVDEANLEDDVVENIRRLLQHIMKRCVRCWDFSIRADAAHIALLILAKSYPINKYDFFNENIPPDKRIVMPSGHQFNIEQLAKCTKCINGKITHINPYNGLEFNPKDEQRILEKFKEQTSSTFNLRSFSSWEENPGRQTSRGGETATDIQESEITPALRFTP